jgi:hypothetical protein
MELGQQSCLKRKPKEHVEFPFFRQEWVNKAGTNCFLNTLFIVTRCFKINNALLFLRQPQKKLSNLKLNSITPIIARLEKNST